EVGWSTTVASERVADPWQSDVPMNDSCANWCACLRRRRFTRQPRVSRRRRDTLGRRPTSRPNSERVPQRSPPAQTAWLAYSKYNFHEFTLARLAMECSFLTGLSLMCNPFRVGARMGSIDPGYPGKAGVPWAG